MIDVNESEMIMLRINTLFNHVLKDNYDKIPKLHKNNEDDINIEFL